MSSTSMNLTVSTEELKAQSTILKTYLNNMTNTVNDIKTIMSELMSRWTGVSADSHLEFYNREYELIQVKLNRYLTHIKNLEVIAGVFDETEDQAVSIAESLESALGS